MEKPVDFYIREKKIVG